MIGNYEPVVFYVVTEVDVNFIYIYTCIYIYIFKNDDYPPLDALTTMRTLWYHCFL